MESSGGTLVLSDRDFRSAFSLQRDEQKKKHKQGLSNVFSLEFFFTPSVNAL